MSNFKVGEVLIGQNFIENTECNGQECVVIEGLSRTLNFAWNSGECVGFSEVYEVKWADGVVCVVSPHNLRRKQSPAGEQSILNMFKVSPTKRIGEAA